MRGACRVGRAAEKLQAAAREMAHVATVVEATSQPMARRDPLRARMDIIYKEVVTPWLDAAAQQWSLSLRGSLQKLSVQSGRHGRQGAAARTMS